MTSEATTKQKTTYALVMNTHSRQGQGRFGDAKAHLETVPSAQLVKAFAVQDPRDMAARLQEAIGLHPDVLVIGGGDGTVREVVRQVAGVDIACALLPLGTTNNFARSIDVPLDFGEALQVATEGIDRAFDLGGVDDDYFANVVSIGLSARIARRVSDRFKKVAGRLAYALTGAYELLRHSPMDCEVEVNGTVHRFRTHQLVIANGSYHSAVKISRRASTSDGQLVLFAMDSGSRRQLIVNMIRFNLQGLSGLRATEVIRASSLRLTTTPRRRVEVDGEQGDRTPLTFRCLPRAVRFRVPPTDTE